MIERSETNELWRAYRADQREKRDRDDGEYRARLERLEAEGKIRVQQLGDHGVRVRSMVNGRELDYWPRTGAIMHKGVRRQGWRALLRIMGVGAT